MKKFLLVLFLSFFLFNFGIPINTASAVASSIPHIAGSWNSSEKGEIGGDLYTGAGTVDIKTRIDAEGYEVITEFSAKGETKDSKGEVTKYDYKLLSEDVGEVTIRIRQATVHLDDITFSINIESSEKITAELTGSTAEGSPIKAEATLTRTVSGGDGGGGCNVGGFSLLALLFIPMVLFNRKSR